MHSKQCPYCSVAVAVEVLNAALESVRLNKVTPVTQDNIRNSLLSCYAKLPTVDTFDSLSAVHKTLWSRAAGAYKDCIDFSKAGGFPSDANAIVTKRDGERVAARVFPVMFAYQPIRSRGNKAPVGYHWVVFPSDRMYMMLPKNMYVKTHVVP